jgi:hypothetical protein
MGGCDRFNRPRGNRLCLPWRLQQPRPLAGYAISRAVQRVRIDSAEVDGAVLGVA